jgi:hypothetical protein
MVLRDNELVWMRSRGRRAEGREHRAQGQEQREEGTGRRAESIGHRDWELGAGCWVLGKENGGAGGWVMSLKSQKSHKSQVPGAGGRVRGDEETKRLKDEDGTEVSQVLGVPPGLFRKVCHTGLTFHPVEAEKSSAGGQLFKE